MIDTVMTKYFEMDIGTMVISGWEEDDIDYYLIRILTPVWVTFSLLIHPWRPKVSHILIQNAIKLQQIPQSPLKKLIQLRDYNKNWRLQRSVDLKN